MRGRYAVDTKVPAMQTRNEIEQLLKRYGADSFLYGQDSGKVMIGFRAHGRMLRFTLEMPDEKKFARQHRALWRSLLLSIKGKLESVAAGIEHFDEAFLSHIMTPDGRTLAQVLVPQVESMYKTGKMPPLLGFES